MLFLDWNWPSFHPIQSFLQKFIIFWESRPAFTWQILGYERTYFRKHLCLISTGICPTKELLICRLSLNWIWEFYAVLKLNQDLSFSDIFWRTVFWSNLSKVFSLYKSYIILFRSNLTHPFSQFSVWHNQAMHWKLKNALRTKYEFKMRNRKFCVTWGETLFSNISKSKYSPAYQM